MVKLSTPDSATYTENNTKGQRTVTMDEEGVPPAQVERRVLKSHAREWGLHVDKYM